MLPSAFIPPSFDPGSVWLIGAGPGDPGLLTLHALHGLTEAEIILHDALVSDEILSLAGQAVLERAGKRAGGTTTPQLRINQRLIALARQGRRVVRLKGGDPMVFGRGGEEALALAAAGIPFRIVPGVSAGIGGMASAGIPLTHRGIARTVTFITGHDAEATDPGLMTASDVLVFYMAGRNLGSIAERLLRAGRDRDDAVAIIRDATRSAQDVSVMTLADATDKSIDTGPTLIVIGPVVALRDQLRRWQQTAPMEIFPAQSQDQAAG